jgi:hypothetical protein
MAVRHDERRDPRTLRERDDIPSLEKQFDTELRAEALAHRRKYLLLCYQLPRALLDAHRDCLKEVEHELGSSQRRARRTAR